MKNFLALFLAFFIVSCGGKAEGGENASNKSWTENEIQSYYTGLPLGFITNDKQRGYNSDVIFDEDLGGFVIKTHTNIVCELKDSSRCRKGMLAFNETSPATYENHDFYFSFRAGSDFPDWVILFQDWVRIKPEDTNGNHPITTIKLIKDSGRYYLVHYENSWQWDDANYEAGDPYDLNHTHEWQEVERGRFEIVEGSHYKINFYISNAGYAELSVDDNLVSSAYYQTKSPTEKHVIMWGAYWSRYYNLENDPSKSMRMVVYGFGY